MPSHYSRDRLRVHSNIKVHIMIPAKELGFYVTSAMPSPELTLAWTRACTLMLE